jgi:hypothetical protein
MCLGVIILNVLMFNVKDLKKTIILKMMIIYWGPAPLPWSVGELIKVIMSNMYSHHTQRLLTYIETYIVIPIHQISINKNNQESFLSFCFLSNNETHLTEYKKSEACSFSSLTREVAGGQITRARGTRELYICPNHITIILNYINYREESCNSWEWPLHLI